MRNRPSQRGVTLILSLIMLVLLSILAISSFNIGKGSLHVVDNAQQQSQVLQAAQGMINQVISSPKFVDNPALVLDNSNCPTSLSAPTNSRCVDLYGDGKTVILVQLTPQPYCTQATAIKNASLNLSNTEDLGCAVGEGQQLGVEGAVSGASLCSNSMWEITAKGKESVSSAEAVVTQGVSMRVSTDAVSTACP